VLYPAVGLVLDSFNSLAPGIPVDSLRSLRADKLFHVQLADAPKLSMDPLSWSRHFRCMPGQGELPLVEYVRALKRRGYDGVLSLEIFNDRFRAGSTAEVALDGMRSIEYLLEQVEGAPDARTACKGVEFIEFCAGEEEAGQLSQMLGMLGFVATHRHVRKKVTRWRQGDINLVVNCEPDGFAHTFDTVHGASVCAIGVRVADPDAVLRRASQLQVPGFSQPVGPGEYEIPALRGVGGSLLYFMKESETPSIWKTEFEALPVDPSRVDAGLERIDHFSQSMQFEEMLSWLLYYVTLFEVEKSAAIEIADPVGLVQSQAIHSRDRRFRILLNSSAAGQTPRGSLPALLWRRRWCNTVRSQPRTSLPLLRGCASSAWIHCRSPRTTTISARAASRTRVSCAAGGVQHPVRRGRAGHIPSCVHARIREAILRSGAAPIPTGMAPGIPRSAWRRSHASGTSSQGPICRAALRVIFR
jgi:4-hydroxyphenylpyruvate dioxygenase